MSKHTPGPWAWDVDYDVVLGSNKSTVCKIATGEDREEEDANARLIAAAPDLLVACRGLVEAADLRLGAGAIKSALDLARAAISKAG